MGVILWIAKMLIKVMEPFLGSAILQGLLEAVENYVKENNAAADETPEGGETV